MISLTGILSLLSALAATSYALSCTVCQSLTSSSCSGVSVTCPSGEQCGSSYTETIFDGVNTKVFVRRCMSISECRFIGTVSLNKVQTKKVHSCCNTDDCTPSIASFPAKSSEPNELICPSCVSITSASCSSSETVQCRGDETECLLQATTVTGLQSGSSALRGCATKSICDLGSQSQSADGVTTEVKFICTSGGISVRTVVLTPAIVCLLLLKWFF
ncbi:phospholipase A2 inhibitor 25 kDa subunit-like [Hyla sarda]|uniref:phospholipase A2 inhibitor 25 kDa subunit-like n=1 Tax=Hyla sarda TaxID=327740 RepID=UPI0024C43CF5|nr:phospholipase A2 inhibitor 25 kDa subunit-like [Hyla sarda]